MNHSFNVEVAKEVGVLSATVFNSIGYWVNTNRSNRRNLREGRYWTYNTVDAWTEEFPYATKKQVYTALKKLIDAGLVMTGTYNQNPYDRTLWYTLTDRGEFMFYGPSQEDFADSENAILQNGKIEDSKLENLNTDTKPDDNQDAIPYSEIVGYLNDRTGRHYRCVEATKRLIRGRFGEGYTLDDFKTVIDKMCSERMGTDMEKYLRPATLFAPSHFDDYLNWKVQPSREDSANESTRAGLEARGFYGDGASWRPEDFYDR